MRIGKQKPTAPIEAATSRECDGSIFRTSRFVGGGSLSGTLIKPSVGSTSLRKTLSTARWPRPLRRRRPLAFRLTNELWRPRKRDRIVHHDSSLLAWTESWLFDPASSLSDLTPRLRLG